MAERVCVLVGLFLFSFMLFKCFIKIAYDHGLLGSLLGSAAAAGDRPLSASSKEEEGEEVSRRGSSKKISDRYMNAYERQEKQSLKKV